MPAPKDLIHETSTTTGTSNLTIAAVNGKIRFSDSTYGFGTGGSNVFDYYVSNRAAAEWERGTGHMSDANTLVRDTVIASSNSNNAVNFSAGTKDITNDVPAASQCTTSTSQTLTNKNISSSTNTYRAASDTATGAIEIAVQSEMEAGTDTSRAVTPGRQHYHPSAAKVWGFVTVSGGTPTLQTSFNVTSITDTAAGILTVTIATDFSSANYAACVEPTSLDRATSVSEAYILDGTQAAGSIQFIHQNSGGTNEDPVAWHFMMYGDQ